MNVETLLISAKEAAKMLGISQAFFYRLHDAGKVPLPRKLGRRSLWSIQELKDWIAIDCPPLEGWNKGKERLKKARAKLINSYVKDIICHEHPTLKHIDIPEDLVRLRREVIKIRRFIKGVKNDQGKKDCKRHYKRA